MTRLSDGAPDWPFKRTNRMHVRVMRLPRGDDPDSFIRREGPAAFQSMIDNAVPAGEWVMEQRFDKLPDWMTKDAR